VNGRGPKRLGGGRSGDLDGCIAGSYTARECIIVCYYCVYNCYFVFCVLNGHLCLVYVL